MAELVDASDLGSGRFFACGGSSPPVRTHFLPCDVIEPLFQNFKELGVFLCSI